MTTGLAAPTSLEVSSASDPDTANKKDNCKRASTASVETRARAFQMEHLQKKLELEHLKSSRLVQSSTAKAEQRKTVGVSPGKKFLGGAAL